MTLAKAELPDGTEFILTENGWNVDVLNRLYPLEERAGYALGEWQIDQLKNDFKGAKIDIYSRLPSNGPGMIF